MLTGYIIISLGQDCTGNLSGCGNGKKACASNQGGGCCIDGYACSANGCIPEAESSASVSETPTATTTCSNGYYACPSNVAGGCCPSGRLCGVSDCPEMTETGTATVGDTCPTGYYTCAPQYNGGCCRIGRDCGITDCPERAVTISNGDAGAGGLITMTTPAPSCATGWQTCASSVGGGCCPIGYVCGTTDCPAITVGASGYVVSGQVRSLISSFILYSCSRTWTNTDFIDFDSTRYLSGDRQGSAHSNDSNSEQRCFAAAERRRRGKSHCRYCCSRWCCCCCVSHGGEKI